MITWPLCPQVKIPLTLLLSLITLNWCTLPKTISPWHSHWTTFFPLIGFSRVELELQKSCLKAINTIYQFLASIKSSHPTTQNVIMVTLDILFENYSKCRIWIFQFLQFLPIFVLLKLTCLVTLFDRKLQVFKNSPKWTIFGIFN